MSQSRWDIRVQFVATGAVFLALMFIVLLITTVPAPVGYDIGSPGDGRFAIGFWPGEQNTTHSFRWSDGDSAIKLYGYETANAVLFTIRMTAMQQPGVAPPMLTVRADDRELARFPVDDRWRVYRMLADQDSVGWKTPIVRLISRTVRPGIDDQRELGVAVAGAAVRAVGGPQLLSLLERSVFLAALVSLLFLVMLRAARPAAALAIAIILAAVVAVGSLVSPALLAYLLPSLWKLVLILAGALAALLLVDTFVSRIAGAPRWVLFGLVVGLVGQLLLRMWPRSLWLAPFGGVLLIAGAVVAAAAAGSRPVLDRPSVQGSRRDHPRLSDEAALPQAAHLSRLQVGVWLGAFFLVALMLRGYWLESLPFGMWRDEARHGLLALRILHDPTFRPVYVPNEPIRVDLPALLFYLQTGPIALLGPTVAAVRLVPAVAGSLTVFSVYFLGRRLWGSTAGLMAALLLAVSSWHIALSRFASPAVLDPFFTLSGLVLLWRAIDGRKPGQLHSRLLAAGLAGCFMSLALYTYHTGRLVPAAALALLVCYFGLNWRSWLRGIPALLVFGILALAVAAPLINYMLTSPQGFNRRIDQIGTFAQRDDGTPPAAALEHNIVRYTLMWNVEGEHNARHHVPLVPLIDLFSGFFFVVGLLLLLSARRSVHSRLPLLLLLLGLLPGLLSSDAPHALRSVAAIAPSLMIAAYGAARLWQVGVTAYPARSQALTAMLAAGVVLFNIWVYFGHMPYDPRVWGKFEYAEETAIGIYLQKTAAAERAFMPRVVAITDVVQYLTYNVPKVVFSPSDPPSLARGGARVLVPVHAEKEQRWAELVAGRGVRPQPMRPYPGTNEPTFYLYTIPQP